MTTDARPVCVFAMAGLKRNSTKLLIAICIGLALAIYGVYVQARSQSNPAYTPAFSLATKWLYNNLGAKFEQPKKIMGACNRVPFKRAAPQFMINYMVHPMTHYSGMINGFIHIAQIVILKVYCRSVCATDTIMGLSIVGLMVSMICMIGSYTSCRLMCISCCGVHHMFIIYFAMCRRRIIKNMLCPTNNTNEGACPLGGGGGLTGRIFGSSIPTSQNQDLRRRSGRQDKK